MLRELCQASLTLKATERKRRAPTPGSLSQDEKAAAQICDEAAASHVGGRERENVKTVVHICRRNQVRIEEVVFLQYSCFY